MTGETTNQGHGKLACKVKFFQTTGFNGALYTRVKQLHYPFFLIISLGNVQWEAKLERFNSEQLGYVALGARKMFELHFCSCKTDVRI